MLEHTCARVVHSWRNAQRKPALSACRWRPARASSCRRRRSRRHGSWSSKLSCAHAQHWPNPNPNPNQVRAHHKLGNLRAGAGAAGLHATAPPSLFQFQRGAVRESPNPNPNTNPNPNPTPNPSPSPNPNLAQVPCEVAFIFRATPTQTGVLMHVESSRPEAQMPRPVRPPARPASARSSQAQGGLQPQLALGQPWPASARRGQPRPVGRCLLAGRP